MDNFTEEFVDGELEYLGKNRAVDVETYIPAISKKKSGEIEYFSVILVLRNKVKQNNLFNSQEIAVNNFYNLIKEFSHKEVNSRIFAEALMNESFQLPDGSISICKPSINLN